ncbi:MAG: hypothetical protein QNJ98_07085, partial [Planctomycetota bacterium]|nr:hypothetical protein [Planctomycetota bacterium]
DYEVVEVPAQDERFDGAMLSMPRVGRDPHVGAPVVLFEIKPDHVERFKAWTTKNIGLPMAIIVNGEFTGEGRAPTIQAPLSDSVQITLGAMKFAEAERRAQAMATAIQSGAFKVRPTLESVEDLAKDGSG